MAVEVKLPELGAEAGDEATVSYWIAQEGDEVNEGDDIVEMLTDKANFNVPAPCTGKIVSLNAAENEVVKVGDVLCVIDPS